MELIKLKQLLHHTQIGVNIVVINQDTDFDSELYNGTVWEFLDSEENEKDWRIVDVSMIENKLIIKVYE